MGRIQKCLSFILVMCLLFASTGCSKQSESTTATQSATTTEAPSIPEETVPEETAPEETVPAETKPEETVPKQVKNTVAQHIDTGVSITLDGANIASQLTETGFSLSCKVKQHQKLAIDSETPFSALYIEWDVHPGNFYLVWDGGESYCGTEGFLHDYIQLPEAVSSLSFMFEKEGTHSIKELGIYTDGAAPEGVQDWLAPYEAADILAFPTHADDDVLFMGAVIGYYAIEQGLTVQTAFMTDHYYEPIRNHERLDGLWEMGVRRYPIIGTAHDCYTKSLEGAAYVHRNDGILEWQVQLIRRYKPQIILGHDLNGEYGHGQHKYNAHCLIQAVEVAADAQQLPETAAQYGTWDTPKLYLHLYEENQIVFDVNTAMVNDPKGRTPFQVAQDAYACHVSQHKYSFAVSQDPNSTMDCTRFGLYRTLVGYDTGSNLMEHTTKSE